MAGQAENVSARVNDALRLKADHAWAITLGSARCGCIWYRRTGQYQMTALQWI